MYDINNIFAKILRGEIPCKKIHENDYAMSFYDINPLRKVHALVIPKGQFTSMNEFMQSAGDFEITAYWQCVRETIQILGLRDGGYRLITNVGGHGQQEVPHLHFHILGGEPVGKMVS